MYQQILKRRLPLLIIATALIGLVAWTDDHSATAKFRTTDTTPDSRQKKVRNLDELELELEKAEAEIEREFKDFKMPEIHISPIDIDEIMADVAEAMKEIDPKQLRIEIEQSLKDIDTDEMKESIAEAMKEIDAAKIEIEVEAAMAKVNMEEVKKELEHLKKTDFAKMENELKKIKPENEASLKNARVEIEKTKEKVKEFKTFEEALVKDGLISKEAYTLEHKDGELSINGKVQDEVIYNKYRSFLQKHKSFSIKKTADDFDINMD